MTRFLAALLVTAASSAVLAAQGPPPSSASNLGPALAAFKAFYEKSLADNAIVGSSVMVLGGGRVVATDFVGMADTERKHPVDADTIYHWASITKTFTAIGIMQLRDRGLLKLDDPVVKYIPELRGVHDPFGDTSEITIRHLMTHSAGFRGPTWPWGGDKPWQPFEPTKWSQLVAMFPYTEVEFRPGSRYRYSNPGIIFLGRIIELLSGDDYEVYIDKNIFKPLEMYRSYFDHTPYHLLPHRSASYYVKDGKASAAPFDVDTGITVSNGGLNAPLGDMAKYLDFLLGNPGRQAAYDGVLKRASLEEMFVPQLPVEAGPDMPVATAANERVSIGLNFFVEDRAGLRLVAHSGNQNAFSSHFYVCPALRAAYVVAYNTEWEADKEGRNRTTALDEAVRGWLLEKVFPLLK